MKGQQKDGNDPVRVFFTDTWERLAPQLRTLAKQLPEIQGLRYMTFIAATDVIYQLESLGRPFGLEISSEGLRKLARILIKGQQERASLGDVQSAPAQSNDWNYEQNQGVQF